MDEARLCLLSQNQSVIKIQFLILYFLYMTKRLQLNEMRKQKFKLEYQCGVFSFELS